MELRIHYANYLNGEYMSFGELPLTEALSLVEHFPWEQEAQKVRNLIEQPLAPSIKLINHRREHLEIRALFNDDVFEFNIELKFKKTLIWDTIIGYPYDLSTVLSLCQVFSVSAQDVIPILKNKPHFSYPKMLRLLLGRSKDSDVIVTIDPNQRRFITYEAKLARAGFSVFFAAVFITMSWVTASFLPFFLPALWGFLAAPTFVIFANHALHSKSNRLIFEKNSDVFTIDTDGFPTEYSKRSIVSIIKHTSKSGNRVLWGDFIYWAIHFRDGQTVNVSNLSMDEFEIRKEFYAITTVEKKDRHFQLV